MVKQLDVGSILSETVALVQDNLREVLIFTAVIGGLSAIGIVTGITLSSSSTLGIEPYASGTSALSGLALQFAILIATVVGIYFLTKTYLASRNRIVQNTNRFWHYLVMSILAGLGMMIGFLLLIIPGIILLVRWSAATGFVVSGRESIVESLKASWELTRGNAMTIFLAGLVLIIVLIVGLGIIAAALVFANVMLGGIVGSLLDAFSNAVSPAFGIAIYCLLQNDGEDLEEVFS